MKINKISLYNFNSFEGQNEFDFSVGDDEKNIILVGGKNGAGKTSLFSAIKIALYGPLAFGYVGINPHYIAKIKECINSKAFQTRIVEARVQISISIMVEREIKQYVITREWDYSSQKLVENYYVMNGDRKLSEQEQSYFQNYLQSLVPPDLFEFFLFDGEEVGTLFSTKSYDAYVRNAVYVLCGLDIYEIIRKYTRGYAGKASNEDESMVFREYEMIKKSIEEAESAKQKAEMEVEGIQEALDQIETELIEVETAFRNAGGLTKATRAKLSEEFERAERIKAENSAKIKLFVEGLMPFYIVRDFNKKITEQLEIEEKGEIYNYVLKQLSIDDIQRTLAGMVPKDSVSALMKVLLEKLKPEGFSEEATPLHDLSKEETNRVNAMISTVSGFCSNEMVDTVRQKQKAADLTMEINRTLKSAISDEDATQYVAKENALLYKKDELKQELYEKRTALEQLVVQLSELENKREHSWQRVKDTTQNKHVYELSTGLSKIMDTLLGKKTLEVRRKLEQLIVANLQKIYRKNNLITHIEIDESFQFNLYQNATYNAGELVYLLKNLGKNEFAVLIGEQGMEKLFELYNVDSINMLQKCLPYNYTDKIELYKNIDLNRLSKGERQIFILALYWAIIELSGQDIPFVIDTPYARIDANHRREISEKFFPNISKQVIILSTDEEINEEYYEIIKPYIAREYLLINEEDQNKTTVKNHYFFEAEE